MALIHNLSESIYDLYTLDVDCIYMDMTSIENRYRIDMIAIHDL